MPSLPPPWCDPIEFRALPFLGFIFVNGLVRDSMCKKLHYTMVYHEFSPNAVGCQTGLAACPMTGSQYESSHCLPTLGSAPGIKKSAYMMKFCSVPGAPTILSQSIPNASCPCRRVKSSNHCLSSYEIKRSANTLRVSCTHTRVRSTAVDTLRWSVISIPCAVNEASEGWEASGRRHRIFFPEMREKYHNTMFFRKCGRELEAPSLGLAVCASRPGEKNKKNRPLFAAESSAAIAPSLDYYFGSSMACGVLLGLDE